MGIDVERVRADTAGCAEVVHLDNAGSSLPPRPVTDAVVGHLRLEERIGGYRAARAEEARTEHAYDALAALVGAGRDEIAIVENATRAWDMAFYSLPWRPGDRILTSRAEYAGNVIPFLQIARRHGVRVEPVPDDESGALSAGALRDMIDERVRLIAVTHVPTQGGLVNPAAEIGRVAREAGVTYLLDACQSVGQMRVDVREIGCDLLSATGRKFLRGPRGTGFLYCSRRILRDLEPPFLDLHAATWTSAGGYTVHDDARRFENWEGFVAGKIGLGVAADYALGLGLDAIEERVTGLAETLRERLRAIPGVTVRDTGVRRCGIVTFTVDGHESAGVARALSEQAINVSVSWPTSARWDFEARGLPPMVRASVHYYNTEEELDRLCAALPGHPS
ncbi:aminotransferase class V-fold PLP-dependent enzyme [Microbispora corallina]|uniref:Aminotransferase class V n=1 Tax=Microbispora corallina TaxID=83302 RepID=A0ABQ4G360_9ACTN|nr:aminotransferase class V-fold PLP-dependent enzyme [Microbispora corallina]GIH41513.1 aminotransferase class V [Microbispora corallina]